MATTNDRSDSTCGGATASGTPCQRPAGWGTDHLGEGRCREHNEAALVALSGQKERFLETFARLQPVSIRDAARFLDGHVDVFDEEVGRYVRRPDPAGDGGVDERQIWRWCASDDGFKRRFDAIRHEVDYQRLALWEESAFGRIIRGDASSGVEILWVVNTSRRLGDDRWRDLRYSAAPVEEEPKVPLAKWRAYQRERAERMELDDETGTYRLAASSTNGGNL